MYHTSNMADWIECEAMCATVDGAKNGGGDWCDGRNSVPVSVCICVSVSVSVCLRDIIQ